MINDYTGNRIPVEIRPARDWDNSGRRFGETIKSREKLGFIAETNIQDGLKKTVDWTLKKRGLIARAVMQHKIFLPEGTNYNDSQ